MNSRQSLRRNTDNTKLILKLNDLALKTFKCYDTDFNGVLNPYELGTLIQDMSKCLKLKPLNNVELYMILLLLDENRDGTIDCDEFLDKFDGVFNLLSINNQTKNNVKTKKLNRNEYLKTKKNNEVHKIEKFTVFQQIQ